MTELSDPKHSTSYENKNEEMAALSAKKEYSEPTPANVSIYSGPTPLNRKFKSHRIFFKYETNTRQVCREYIDNATDFGLSPLCLFVKEKVKIDPELLSDVEMLKHKPLCNPTNGPRYMEQRRCLFGDGCNKSYLSRRDLKTHYLYHCGIRPFRCNVINCNARYTEFENAEMHAISHPKPVSVKCPLCGFAVNEAKDLKEHVAITHPKMKKKWEMIEIRHKIKYNL
ncbi:Krueppel-like factor 14 [Thelohanellus kitauei]|uniref:Krueppel-like factor 14 n=1 Tax=Thelohanellus kitauei TaxID=669202 RepID=A0A0C2IU95_THEKT|nr:Krueppel-like factor 14 [Thelohanellus kitauei]